MLGATVARRARTPDGARLRVCLVDLDLFGDVGARLGKVTPTILDLARAHPACGPHEVERFLVDERSSGMRVLLAPMTPDARNRSVLTPDLYHRAVDGIGATHDLVILDCGTELTDPVLSTYALPAADRILVVVNNETATLAAAATALDIITGSRIGYPAERLRLILNQRAEDVGITDADVLSRLPHVSRIAARIPDDRRLFVTSANLGRPIVSSDDLATDRGIEHLVHAARPDLLLDDLDQVEGPVPAASGAASFAALARRLVPRRRTQRS
jgi:MinD-like ATPase involved in chromosome partitioning or flagellar assembly